LVPPRAIREKDVEADLKRNTPPARDRPSPRSQVDFGLGISPPPEFSGFLAARLPGGVSDLGNLPAKASWAIIAETVENMYSVINRFVLNDFNRQIAKMYDKDLLAIIRYVDKFGQKFPGYETLSRYLGLCRVKASLVIKYYGGTPIEHEVALQSIVDLQTNLKIAIEYIEPILMMLSQEDRD
jgi:hypothetical protein